MAKFPKPQNGGTVRFRPERGQGSPSDTPEFSYLSCLLSDHVSCEDCVSSASLLFRTALLLHRDLPNIPKSPIRMSGNLQREGGSSTHNSKQSAAKPSRKRAQYTRHACTLCKASKVRCDGQLPCAFCAARGGAICSYSAPALPGFQVRDRRPVYETANP